jgi:phosphoenolpyruvate synthase/pyruvate phosphate dikinase
MHQIEFIQMLERVNRVVEWAHTGALLAFAEVWPEWTYLLPEITLIGDDILRGSPLLLFGQAMTRINDYAAGQQRKRHQIFGTEITSQIRALNPGLALGKLRVNPKDGTYSREEILALAQTPAELQPAAGIVTQGEGNVVSHVQLLARALGIPNVVTGPEPFKKIADHDAKNVFFLVTPGGRVYLKEAAKMTDQDKTVYDQYNRSTERTTDGQLGAGAGKLDIDHEKLDTSIKIPMGPTEVGLEDSGVKCGPKAAYLGELKRLLPDNVSRGIVLPFGVYFDHFQKAKVAVPDGLKNSNIAKPGEALEGFVKSTYQKLFEEMIPAGTSEKELTAWIKPRLDIFRTSIMEHPMAPELKQAIQKALDDQGLLLSEDKSQTVGCFVRSDTNVEDLENFNGAGLNLTIFNLRSLDDIYAGVKKVWASPFTLRSFSWRQTLVDEPFWVLPSVVIMESVRSEKSGVLVTADIFHGDPDKMLVATSEGVGGAVDGTPAETLLWSPQGVELINLYKSPRRLMLKPEGGSEITPSTGKEYVLSEKELKELIAAAGKIKKAFKPSQDESGKPRPWDIEFGFAKGQLWLFQCRPFIGNEELRNIPALAALDGTGEPARGDISLEDVVK